MRLRAQGLERRVDVRLDVQRVVEGQDDLAVPVDHVCLPAGQQTQEVRGDA